MRRKITIINPTPAKKIKRFKKRKKRVLKKRRLLRNKKTTFNNLKRSAAVAKKTRSKTKRTRARKNPGGVTYIKNRKRVRSRRRSRKLFRNPIDAALGSKTTDILVMSAGAAAGGIGAPWLGNIFQLSGMVKTAAQLGVALAGYYLLGKIGMRKAALPFAAGAVAVTAYQFAQDNNILAGLSGDQLTPDDVARLNAMQNSIGAVMPGVGAVMPGIGNIMPGVNGTSIYDTDDQEVYSEYGEPIY